jgi:hypothetical protein
MADFEFGSEMDIYQRKFQGMYGEFGAGGNAKVRFVQTALRPEALESVDLISSIPGSEKWDVVDLFQRNVDLDRVTNSIMPYLEDNTKIKFFNPLTLVVLPLDDTGKQVKKALPKLQPAPRETDNKTILLYESYFRLILNSSGTQGIVEFNPETCRLVAIDGQHRLSAIQRLHHKPEARVDISAWRVPVVILVVEKDDPSEDAANLLQLIRNMFVYINTQAVTVTPNRQILLDDESPNSVCTQEFVRHCHSNDIKPVEDRDPTVMPLLLIDWRGETSGHRPVTTPAALISVEEIKLWHDSFLIGEDFGYQQKAILGVDDAMPPISGFRKDGSLSPQEADWIRDQYTERILPGIMAFFRGFDPYREYIANLRAKEIELLADSDISQHAFMKLRFGTHDATGDEAQLVDKFYARLVQDVGSLKDKTLDHLLKYDIGIRAVVYAFGKLKTVVDDERLSKGEDRWSWVEYSETVVPFFNEVRNEKWFAADGDATDFDGPDEIPEFLSLIAFDASGGITNYRISDMDGGLGSLIMLVIASKIVRSGKMSDQFIKELWEEHQIALDKTIQREARKLHKAQLRATFKGSMDEFNAKVKRAAQATAEERLQRIASYIGLES